MRGSMSSTAERIKEFIPKFLTLTDGFAGQPFELLDWQKEFIDTLFSEEDGERVYNSVILEIPRKNAKTTLAAALALVSLIGLAGGSSPYIVCAAYTREQARLLFDKCTQMILQNSDLSRDFIVRRSHIEYPANGGILKIVSSEAGGAHGLNPSMVICDELHTWKSSELWAALTTGSGTRKDFLVLGITTAGHDQKSLLGDLRASGMKVRHLQNGVWKGSEPSSSLYVTYGAEDGEVYDPEDWEAFKRHNPSWPIMSEKSFKSQCELNSEGYLRQLFHNEWLDAAVGWMPVGAWELAEDAGRSIALGSRVVLGVDASKSGDATACVMTEVSSGHIVPLAVWEKPDNLLDWVVPMGELKEVIKGACENFEVVEVSYDPYFCLAVMQDLASEGVNAVEFPTSSFSKMAPATADFYYSAIRGELSHSGDDVLRTHVYNCASKMTPAGVIIAKQKQTAKIDAATAAIISYSRARYWRNVKPRAAASGEVLLLEM